MNVLHPITPLLHLAFRGNHPASPGVLNDAKQAASNNITLFGLCMLQLLHVSPVTNKPTEFKYRFDLQCL